MANTIIQGDYGYDLNFTLTENGTALDLTDGTVLFKMGAKINAACVIDDAVSGTCHYTLAEGDTDTVTSYPWEIEVTYASKVVTCKGSEHIQIISQL